MRGSDRRRTGIAAAAAAVSLLLSGQAAVPARYKAVVREIGTHRVVNGIPTDGAPLSYCLFLAGDRVEPDYLSGTINNVALVHPVPAVMARMGQKAPRRWYAAYTGSTGAVVVNGFQPLLSEEVWKTIPARMRHVLAAMGIDNADLVLVSCNLNTGSIAVYFLPIHDKDRAYYERELQLLQSYVRTHDMDADLGLDQVLAGTADRGETR